ncbi:hypothetical protein ABPG72_019824 [Tetrahymena utriculariae]
MDNQELFSGRIGGKFTDFQRGYIQALYDQDIKPVRIAEIMKISENVWHMRTSYIEKWGFWLKVQNPYSYHQIPFQLPNAQNILFLSIINSSILKYFILNHFNHPKHKTFYSYRQSTVPFQNISSQNDLQYKQQSKVTHVFTPRIKKSAGLPYSIQPERVLGGLRPLKMREGGICPVLAIKWGHIALSLLGLSLFINFCTFTIQNKNKNKKKIPQRYNKDTINILQRGNQKIRFDFDSIQFVMIKLKIPNNQKQRHKKYILSIYFCDVYQKDNIQPERAVKGEQPSSQ